MMICTRRALFAAAAGFCAGRAFAQRARLRPGCQANAWNLDPQKFDLLLTAIREMKELEFQGFETNIRFIEPQLDGVAEARAQIESIGLEFIGAHTNLPRYDQIGLDASADQLGKAAENARKFGAHAIVLSHGGLSRTGEFSQQALDEKARALDLAGRRIADAGLTLAYHNHEPEFANHAAEETGLVRQTDPKLVWLLLDIGHAWRSDPDAVQFFAEHHARIFGLHLRDYHNGVSVPLGQGEFPLRDLATAVTKTQWSGWLIDEEERPNDKVKPGKAATGPSRKTMREIFGV
jgi:sugar phosphate isomerase/epimerase